MVQQSLHSITGNLLIRLAWKVRRPRELDRTDWLKQTSAGWSVGVPPRLHFEEALLVQGLFTFSASVVEAQKSPSSSRGRACALESVGVRLRHLSCARHILAKVF